MKPLLVKLRIFGVIFFIFFGKLVVGQHNFLGKTQEYIVKYFDHDPEYTVVIDTIGKNILLTCKTSQPYPYYTYELDMKSNRCISFGIVSKNRELLDGYIDMLDYLGKIVQRDSAFTNVTYQIDLPNVRCYFLLKQPFVNSEYISRRNIFYILVTEEEY